MALINCPECGREISDKAKVCIHCGYPLAELNTDVNDNKNVEEKYDLVLVHCGGNATGVAGILISLEKMSFDEAYAKASSNTVLIKGKPLSEIQAVANKLMAAGARVELRDSTGNECAIPGDWGEATASVLSQDTPRCPKCGSSAVQIVKKGYSLGKAAVGLAVAGPVGLLGGKIGSNNTVRVCVNCNHKW